MGSSISINGRRIEFGDDGSIFVNGRKFGPVDGGPVEVEPVDVGNRTLTLDRDGRVVGDVKGRLEVVANAPCTLVIEGSVGGSVSAGGNVTCKSVGGSVNAGGSVTAERIGGSTNAGGSVYVGRSAP